MSWFKRLKEGIQTATKNKKETPDGLWHKCTRCNEMTTVNDLKENLYICPKCDFHTRISSTDYFEILFDGKYTRLFDEVKSIDMLSFKDVKSYKDRLDEAYKKTKLNDSMSVAHGKVGKYPLVVAAMDFGFIGGSMGSVVGEKISRAIDFALANKMPLMIISKSGGARMMESAFSLMQMAKTSAKLTLLARNGIPFLSFLTDPTTGGVTASYAMLGDINLAEPKALIGFAGPRVIQETIKTELPADFQTSEYLLEHGFLDFIVHRKALKETLIDVLSMLKVKNSDIASEVDE